MWRRTTELIDEHRTELSDLCQLYRVKKLEVFGSGADGTFDPRRSDLDFLVEFQPCPLALIRRPTLARGSLCKPVREAS